MENKLKEDKGKRREEAEEIQKMNCRMFENKFPNIDDLVMVYKYITKVSNKDHLRRWSLCRIVGI
jgi:hypothetical protein